MQPFSGTRASHSSCGLVSSVCLAVTFGVMCLISAHHPRARGGAPSQPGWRRCWFLFCRGNGASPHPPTRALPVSVGLLCPAWQVTAPKGAVTLSSHGGGSAVSHPTAGCNVCRICVLLEGWIWDSQLGSKSWCIHSSSASQAPFVTFHGRLKNHQESAGGVENPK